MKLTFPLVLFTVFLVLRLTETIDWSWWWVTAPLWISFLVGLAFVIVVEYLKSKVR